MSTFSLVHGAWHGAWCWERPVPELESMGHRVVAIDLPSDDPSACFDDYADVVCAALSDHPGDNLILIGHSLAGNTIPLVDAVRGSIQRLRITTCSAIVTDPPRQLHSCRGHAN